MPKGDLYQPLVTNSFIPELIPQIMSSASLPTENLIDVFSAFGGTTPEAQYYASDQVYLTDEGYAFYA